MFRKGDKVRDVRFDMEATVVYVDNTGQGGDDGQGIIVRYDDEPDTNVSTGSDYFEEA